MFEVGVAVLVFLYLVLLAAPSIEAESAIGGALTLLGLVGGGAAGIAYHMALRRTLIRLGEATRGWLWSPVSRHAALDQRGRQDVLPWFRVGAAGFVVCLAGMGMVAVAILRAMLAG